MGLSSHLEPFLWTSCRPSCPLPGYQLMMAGWGYLLCIPSVSWCPKQSKTPIYTFDGEQTVLQPTSSSSSLSHAPRRARFCGKWRITCSAPVGPQSGGQEGRLCSLLYSVWFLRAFGILTDGNFSFLPPCSKTSTSTSSSYLRCFWFNPTWTSLSRKGNSSHGAQEPQGGPGPGARKILWIQAAISCLLASLFYFPYR